jgi:hypothetical protein
MIMKDNISYPPKQFKDDEARRLWPSVSREIRSEIVRACRELSFGVGIAKDAVMGRPKYCPDGFYGLAVAENELYRLEHTDATDADLRQARERVWVLEGKLKDDEAEIEHRRAVIREYEPIAKAAGQTLAQWIGDHIEVEKALASDPIEGIFKACDLVGLEPLAVLMSAARQPAKQAAAV